MNVLYPTFALLSVLFSIASAEIEGKRSFSELGCMGVYDKAKFTRLDRMCEECYQLYRETDVHTECRLNCFKNDHFLNCVDTLLYKKDSQQLDIMVEKLYGRRK